MLVVIRRVYHGLAIIARGCIMRVWRDTGVLAKAACRTLRGSPATKVYLTIATKGKAVEERELTQKEIDSKVALELSEAELNRSQIAMNEAEARKTKAEALEAESKAQVADYMAKKSAMDYEVHVEKNARRLADDDHHKVYRFDSAVNDQAVQNAITELSYWDRTCPDCPITIVFNSPGGSVIAGMALYDFVRDLSRKGHEITTVCAGYAASMAGILLQAGDIRVCGPESYILIHEIAAGTVGKIGEIQDAVTFYEKICDRVLNIFVNRSGGKLSKRVMKKNWTRKDWWIDSDEALKLGIVDEVR